MCADNIQLEKIMPPHLRPLSLDKHARREHFHLYGSMTPCSFAVTKDIAIDGVLEQRKRTGASFYALMLHALLRVANSMDELRWDWIDRERRQPGIWSEVGASFTFFHPDAETFSILWLPWEQEQSVFAERYADLVERFGDRRELLPMGPIPPHALSISMIPWINYSAFQVHLPDPLYLRPVITMGRFRVGSGGTFMPLTLQLHHAVGDGWHAGKFFGAVENFTTAGGD